MSEREGERAQRARHIPSLTLSSLSSSLSYSHQKLSEIKGLSEAKVDKMIEAARALASGFDWTSAREVEVVRARDVLRISSGAAEVDAVLGGGFETQAITEIYGEYRTGKTQLCHTLCVTAQLPVGSGGAAGKVAFVDAEGTFRPERVRPIAARFGLDADAVLDNILHARAFTFEQQDALLDGLAAKMAEEPVRLVIIDSLTANLRVDFQGRGELADRQQKLAAFLARLSKLASEFNAAVIVTNLVMAEPSGMAFGPTYKAIGGHVLAHASTVRLAVRKGKAEQRVLKVVQAPNLPEAEASYCITDAGVGPYTD